MGTQLLPSSGRLLTWLALIFAIVLIAGPAFAERVHVVARGHTLGKIAKRYNITIGQLCEANKIRRRDRLKVGQRLLIPGRDEALALRESPSQRRVQASAHGDKKDKTYDEDGPFTAHVVSRGHTLGGIARRYRTSLSAIRAANRIGPRDPLKVGACLVVPLTIRSAERQRMRRLPCIPDPIDVAKLEDARRPSNPYARRPRRSGVIHVVRGGWSFQGRLFDREGRPIEENVAKVDSILFDRRTSRTHSTDRQLLRRLVQVSDNFGGRRIVVVSGYREESSNPYTTRSNHASGRAIDFRIEGVPNEAVRDYCHGLVKVGVGYYPNSSFVHLDVRTISTYWTDVSEPGEPPRYTSMGGPKPDEK